MGTNTDPYQPVERELNITRRILEVLSAHDHPVGIVTKSSLVIRDLDILGPMGQKGLAQVCLSITTLDRKLSRELEPRCPTPTRRLETIQACADAGIQTGVMAAPMIPVLNDPELELILEAASGAGATIAGYILLRLPLEIKDLFREWLETHTPMKAEHVLNAIRGTRAGQMYVPRFGERMRGTGVYAKLLEQRFNKTCRRLGLNERHHELRTDLFKRPTPLEIQPSLFD